MSRGPRTEELFVEQGKLWGLDIEEFRAQLHDSTIWNYANSLEKEADLWRALVWQLREELEHMYDMDCSDDGSQAIWGALSKFNEMIEECELKLDLK